MKHLKAPTGLAQLPTISCKNKSLRIDDFLAIVSSEHTLHSILFTVQGVCI